VLDRTENKNRQEKSFLELLTPETNPLMNHNKEIRDELQAFVDIIKTVRRVRHIKEIECHMENLISDIRPFIKESKLIYFQSIGTFSLIL
jgi:archaellum component FlaC